MKRSILLLGAFTLILVIALGCSKKANEEQLFNDAKKLQEEGKFSEAVTAYEKLVEVHPKGNLAPQAQFMIGFICANELKDLEKAKTAYTTFLENYSDKCDSGMVASAKWELEHLGQDINQIEDLSNITKGSESAPEGETQPKTEKK